ncbi:hypothetical protein H310_08109 [Aphanomyces invadans]|uniref:FYVE-type domain-containing protein n=1 Tax=Aphanomyces invadans TaxID=157072 RepID=A0A024TZK7_9STRA|nr:hypothetical protein H310_08109 [Aphanomyces invadans]ETV99413.1 hypothetical protein H310_08109 [Aphanomyces invadans]|eukprot:XP_008871969.1 hypothetical protein H310_08109 [Aphanomyces invadans]
MDIPVKSTFFPPVRLSPRETSAYYAKATRALDKVREAATTFSWKRVENKDGLVVGKVHIVEQHVSAAPHRVGKNTACLVMRGTTTVRATVAEIVHLLGATDTTDARKSMNRLHGRNFVDTMTLARIECSDDKMASCRVKWAAYKEVDTNVDYCFLEYSGMELDVRGSPLGFCIQASIDRPKEVPSLAALGFRRDEYHRTGFLVYPSLENPEAVHVTAIVQGSSSDKSSLEKVESNLHHRISRVLLSLPDFVTMRRLGALPAVDRTQWIQDSSRRFCAVCLKSFHFARKHHCRLCGEVVCGTCAAPREVDIPSLGSSALVRVCSVCVGRAHAAAGQHAAIAATAQRFPRQRPRQSLQPATSPSALSPPYAQDDDSTNNQLAVDAFDVVDRKALANHYKSHLDHHDDDTDSRTTLGTIDATDGHGNIADFDQPLGPQQRLPSTHRPHQHLTTTNKAQHILLDLSEFASNVQHQRPHTIESRQDQDVQHSKESTVLANAQNVHELSMRLTKIREMLNQSMPQPPPPPPPVHSTAWLVLSPSSVQMQLFHGQQDRAFELLDDSDDDDGHNAIQSEGQPRPPVQGSELETLNSADDRTSSIFIGDDGTADDLSYSLQDDECSNPHVDERHSMSGVDSNDEGIDIHGDFHDDDDDDLLYSHTMLAGSAKSPIHVLSDNVPIKVDAALEADVTNSTAAPAAANVDTRDGQSRSEVDELKSQLSELRKLLANANQRLHAVEATVTQSPHVKAASTKMEKAIRVVELQTGNAATDPCVMQRRHAHRAVVLELQAIMGLE